MILGIIQARMGSTRLPGKVLREIEGNSLLSILLSRLSRSKKIDKIIVATSCKEQDDPIIDVCNSLGYDSFRGSEDDVLSRYFDAAKQYNASSIVRITGDCPLIDASLVDKVISEFEKNDVDYASNIEPPTFPDGLDIEVFSFNALNKAESEGSSKLEREHVTTYLRKNKKINRVNVSNHVDHSGLRWTVDDPEDFEVIENIIRYFSPKLNFSWEEVLKLYESKPDYFSANSDISRNKGSEMSKGQKLWSRAKKVIPGGNMLLSKRPEMFLPGKWPSYFSKSKGCKVWDLDENEFVDFSYMGIGTNILGYGHPEVDGVVEEVIKKGNMSTLNCPEEVLLAEKLVEFHPWADMVKFARSGGEANSVAIRIARAAAGGDNVAICGYHGWHDWYLSANLGDKETLAGHLLPGLDPSGVPNNLRGTVHPFSYNNFEELKELVASKDISVIKMEVVRNTQPEDGFLQKVRDLANKHNIILIFDECTSGFRQSFGGIHKCFDVEPDIAIFGKALGNGYAITAVIGRSEIMQAAQSTFISSTFWTERIGPTAALKTLDVMEAMNSWEIITSIGKDIQKGWRELAEKHNLQLEFNGIPALASFNFKDENHLTFKTFLTQEMLKKGFLASTNVYACIDHNQELIEEYFYHLDPIFKRISQERSNISNLLEGPQAHSGFKRLN